MPIYMHIYQRHQSLWWNTEIPVYINIYLIFPLLVIDFFFPLTFHFVLKRKLQKLYAS